LKANNNPYIRLKASLGSIYDWKKKISSLKYQQEIDRKSMPLKRTTQTYTPDLIY
jgi:hypothetical protein